MIDINFDTKVARRRGDVTGVVRRRHWSAEEKGRIVADAIVPGAIIAEVARRHDLAPQHLSNWIRAAKDGHFALAGDVTFVPVIGDERPRGSHGKEPPCGPCRDGAIEICIGDLTVRVRRGSDLDLLRPVLNAVRRS
jgi:transposase